MDIAATESAPNADALVRDIDRYDLAPHIVDLAAYGFTVVPPEKLPTSPDFVDRLRSTMIRVHEERTGSAIGDFRKAQTLDPGVAPGTASTPPWWWLLESDDVVVEAALNPVVLTLTRWLLGQSAVLSATTMILKPPAATDAEMPERLHNDTIGVPSPLPHYAQTANTSWILTDYDGPDDGATVLVPGSHHFGRVPQPYEFDGPPAGATWRSIPLQARAGSLAVWHGHTWHGGGVPRRNPGLRVTLVLYWSRQYMRAIHDWASGISPGLVDRFPELKRILAIDHPYPYRERNERFDLIAPFQELARDPFA